MYLNWLFVCDQIWAKTRKAEVNSSLYGCSLISHWFELCHQITLRNLASRPFNIYPNGLTKIYPLQRSTNGKPKHLLMSFEFHCLSPKAPVREGFSGEFLNWSFGCTASLPSRVSGELQQQYRRCRGIKQTYLPMWDQQRMRDKLINKTSTRKFMSADAPTHISRSWYHQQLNVVLYDVVVSVVSPPSGDAVNWMLETTCFILNIWLDLYPWEQATTSKCFTRREKILETSNLI